MAESGKDMCVRARTCVSAPVCAHSFRAQKTKQHQNKNRIKLKGKKKRHMHLGIFRSCSASVSVRGSSEMENFGWQTNEKDVHKQTKYICRDQIEDIQVARNASKKRHCERVGERAIHAHSQNQKQ